MNLRCVHDMELDLACFCHREYTFAKEGERGSRFLRITITDNHEPVTIPAGTTATLWWNSSDGYKCSEPGTINPDGTVTVMLTDEMTDHVGQATACITLDFDDGGRLSTDDFIAYVIGAVSSKRIIL